MQTKEKEELKVFMSNRETTCADCNCPISKNDLIIIEKNGQALCLSCADLDHLVFLPSGNTALTTRSQKISVLSAVVYKFSSARKRNERQGILVEAAALEKAEGECMEDEELRERRRKRDAIRREKLDAQYIEQFAKQIRQRYPNCPEKREFEIAEHACEKYSGRVGRSAAAKELSDYTIDLAVRAHIRHAETQYDELLMQGYSRDDARELINATIDNVLDKWR